MMQSSGLLVGLWGGAVAAAALASPPLPAGEIAPPLQIVMDNRDALWPVGLNHALQMACLAEQGIGGAEAEARVQPVPPAVLNAFVAGRTEQLFDGTRQATYRTNQTLYLHTKSADCSRPKLYRTYRVDVSDACTLSAHAESFMKDPATGAAAPTVFKTGAPDTKTPTCLRGAPPPQKRRDFTGVPVYSVAGLPCVSTTDLIVKALRQAMVPREFLQGEGADTCLWAPLPHYNLQDGRAVVVAVADGRTAAQIALDARVASLNGLKQSNLVYLPVSFVVDRPVPAQRFSSEAARAFVNQPAEVEMTQAHAGLQ
jgi:hypothetical protein